MVGLNTARRPLESTTYASVDTVNKILHVIWTGCSTTNQSEAQQFLLSLEHPEENEKPLLMHCSLLDQTAQSFTVTETCFEYIPLLIHQS